MSQSIFNSERIQELRELDDDGSQDTLNSLIDMYLENTQKSLLDLKANFDQKNFSQMKKTAHSIRSSSLNVGAEIMAQLASVIEYSTDDSQLGTSLINLDQQFIIVKTELSKIRG